MKTKKIQKKITQLIQVNQNKDLSHQERQLAVFILLYSAYVEDCYKPFNKHKLSGYDRLKKYAVTRGYKKLADIGFLNKEGQSYVINQSFFSPKEIKYHAPNYIGLCLLSLVTGLKPRESTVFRAYFSHNLGIHNPSLTQISNETGVLIRHISSTFKVLSTPYINGEWNKKFIIDKIGSFSYEGKRSTPIYRLALSIQELTHTLQTRYFNGFKSTQIEQSNQELKPEPLKLLA